MNKSELELVKKVLADKSIQTYIKKQSDSILKQFERQKIVVWCQSCNTVFLDMLYLDFLKQHSMDPEQPDVWFVKCAKHYVNNKNHIIFQSVPKQGTTEITGLFKGWYSEKIIDYLTDDNILIEIKRYLDGCNQEPRRLL